MNLINTCVQMTIRGCESGLDYKQPMASFDGLVKLVQIASSGVQEVVEGLTKGVGVNKPLHRAEGIEETSAGRSRGKVSPEKPLTVETPGIEPECLD